MTEEKRIYTQNSIFSEVKLYNTSTLLLDMKDGSQAKFISDGLRIRT